MRVAGIQELTPSPTAHRMSTSRKLELTVVLSLDFRHPDMESRLSKGCFNHQAKCPP